MHYAGAQQKGFVHQKVVSRVQKGEQIKSDKCKVQTDIQD